LTVTPVTLLFLILTSSIIVIASAVSFGFIQTNTQLSANNYAFSTLQNEISQQNSALSSLKSEVSSGHGTITTTITIIIPPPPTSQSTTSSSSETTITCESTEYTVKQGDTLRSIASNYGITWQILAYANGLPISNSSTVSEGEQLAVPVAGTCIVYKVVSGDYVYKIAEELGFQNVSAETALIIQVNHIPCNPKFCLITPDEELFIVIPIGS
jgi:LysM repeat protein